MGAWRARLGAIAGGLPRTYWILWAGTLVNRLASFVLPFLAIYLTRGRGCSVAEAGLVASLYGLGTVGSGPLGGFLADRLGRRATLLLGLALGGTAAILLGLVYSLAAIGALAFALGLVGELYRPAVQAAVADLVPPSERPHAYGLLYWAINLGFAVSVSAAGLLSEYGYALLFVIDGSTSLVFALIVWLGVPETRPPASRERSTEALAGVVAPFVDAVYAPFLLLNFLLVLLFWQFQVALPLDMLAHGVSPATYGLLIGLNGLLIVVLQPFAGDWLRNFDKSHVLAFAALLVGIGFGLNAVVSSVPLYAVAIVVWTLGEIANAPIAVALAADLAPERLRGRYQGAFGMSWGVAALAAPAAGSTIMDRFGAPVVWWGCLSLGVVTALGQLAVAAPRRRRLERVLSLGREPRSPSPPVATPAPTAGEPSSSP